ncbi:bifunctional 3-deoxy-7-phosphoheptulonate synthase/chorismate mutase [Paenibacillus flagellatus]|uniref:3-deoxy-7-phosphoheptulonate synthase n=1 Tax=Paenibacillus flagellatus TaxID=2211139 RepID=A0A2V5K300_9BACL|nr:bifunctional 3-deoxy-7-phosphoheptulonate synthase/chorismate mutase [Paenibacillus flagellatus]PYI53571.1 3-deoxy-7-phosphoheptulonate synthase [Paenibacillus flagellatus]
MSEEMLNDMRSRVDRIDDQLLELLSERARIGLRIGELKAGLNRPLRDPDREKETLNRLAARNAGPFDEAAVRRLFREIVKATLELQQPEKKKALLVSRKSKADDTVIRLGDTAIGGGQPVLVAGPCSVESREQVRRTAAALAEAGVPVIRGGAFKPRTSPYDFQGLGFEGLKLLKEAADEFGLLAISEIVDPRHLEQACDYVDIIQIGARNMHNFELLKAAGELRKPVLLKRGLAATMDEFLHAAEYIVSRGNGEVMLIERGIRTYEKWTRNTLDISAVPLLKRESHLPVLVDVSHSTGRKDIMAPCAKAALAAGADGIMVEVHPNPPEALSDADQQLDFDEFREFVREVKASGLYRQGAPAAT